MNAEYVTGDEQRAVVPTVTRNDYLRALRRLSRQDHPDLLVAYLDRIRRWTARMDWSDLDRTRAHLDATNAFIDANDAEDRGLRLLDLTTQQPALTASEPPAGGAASIDPDDPEMPDPQRAPHSSSSSRSSIT